MKAPLIKLFFAAFSLFTSIIASGQLVISNAPNGLALAQKLVGDGVTISNVTFTGLPVMAGFFNNLGGTNINIDSGIVLTNGRASSRPPNTGLEGPSSLNAHNILNQPGDVDLSAIVMAPTNDACVLQFDFVPLGDSIRFNYVFSSEEYPDYACSQFNDAFAFFIQGPGIPGMQNIALIPNTTAPVTITNINDQACAAYPQYYVNNAGNPFFTHNGHTTVFTAVAKVQPCQVYTLKLVIADVVDGDFDSGVFLQAKSLTSNAIGMDNLTQTDPSGNSYLVEGCATGAFNIRRPRKDPVALSVSLSYGGTALNGIDVQTLPTIVTIPANDSFVTVNVIPLVDGIPEGIETLKVYALAGCAAGTPTDSTLIQIRDYDILSLAPDTAYICKNSSIQLVASTGYSIYQWDPDPTLSSTSIRNPIATPVNSATTYICTAIEGTCNAKDSVFIKWKDLEFLSKQDVNCRNASTGNIKVTGGNEWLAPIEYSLDGINWQASGDFFNLPVGVYRVKVRDATCIDSITVNIVQAFPDLVINNAAITAASCSGNPDGQLTVSSSGGNNPYSYSIDGINFQSSNIFNLIAGNYTLTLKDNNGCLANQNLVIPLNNIVTIDASNDTSICEGTSYIIPAISNATGYAWTPNGTLTGANTLTPVASPSVTTKYYVVATTGICTRTDSILINVRPAPVPDAGSDIAVCFGKIFQLNGSGGVTYHWSPSTYITTSPDIAAPTAKATDDITYFLVVTDATGCISLTSDAVKVDVTPAVKIFAGKDTVAAINQPMQLKVIETGNSGVTQYSWSPGTFLNDPNIDKPVATMPYDMRYIVTGTTAEGCEGMDDIIIKVYKGPDIYVPSGFTPNNDGRNDLLRAIPVGIKDFKYFRVFNRWGQMIFSTSDPFKGWDGKINGVDQQTGTYVWIAEAIDYKGNLVSRKGVVTIVR
jgi:gliding motility-associated-like protein